MKVLLFCFNILSIYKMTQCSTLNEKLSNLQLNKLESGTKKLY